MWLRAGRAQRQLTLDDVARVTKIQARILAKIEAGQLEGLPAEVFVRGFVKSFARCVGLDESEAAQRYGACKDAPMTAQSSVARAFVETLVAAPTREPKAVPSLLVEPEIFPEASLEMTAESIYTVDVEIEIEAAPVVAAPRIEVVEIPAIEVIEAAPVVASDEPAKKKRTRKKATGVAGTAAPRSRKKKVTDQPLEAAPVAAPSIEALAVEPTAIVETKASASGSFALGALGAVDASAADEMFGPSTNASAQSIDDDSLIDAAVVAETAAPIDTGELELAQGTEPVVADPWKPTMPPVAPSVPWKRPAYPISKATGSFTLPSLVIDDSDPDLADREREDRASAAKPGPHRVSFLPPILLDRDDKSSRQGGLTLAVILLLIAATLTLSYLMRRPSVSGDGMTQNQIVDTTTVVA